MNRMLCCLLVSCAAACSGSRYAERAQPLPPPMPAAAAAPAKVPTAAAPAPAPAPAAAEPDSEARRAWFEQEIERARYVPPPPPPEPAAPVVERLVYVQGDAYGRPDPYYDGRPYTTFPLNTALGAGLGAVIGHQSGHCDEGAWIGGGVGLLIDLWPRW